MLIEFRFKNFRSFRDETKLSMVASTDKTLPENKMSLTGFGGRSLVRSAVVYGANAAGKSNLIAAMQALLAFINTSTDRKINSPIEITPFLLLAEQNAEPSEFEITFIDHEKVRYQYGFQVNTKQVVREWLVVYPKGLPQTWFERENNKDGTPTWYFGRNLKGKNGQLAELTRPDVLFLSNAARLNHGQLLGVLKWIQKSFLVIGDSDDNLFFRIYSAFLAKEDKKVQERIRGLLNVADVGISDFEIREEPQKEKEPYEEIPVEMRGQTPSLERLSVFMQHTIGSEKSIVFPIEDESRGTQRLFALGGPLADILENGWTLFVDELDASLHPLLVRYLVELFHNSKINPIGAQLIFNTHDTTLLDGGLFRRDQIWFVEKDRQGCSHLYPLLDYSPRKDESLAKGYLLGRYGAIPFLSEPHWGRNAETKT